MSVWTITEDTARTYKPKEPKEDHIRFDEKFPGFGLRIRKDLKTGREHRSFIYQYKLGAQHRRMNCGKVGKVTAALARKAAAKHAAALVNHQDPANDRAEVRKQASHTLGAAITRYLEAIKPSMRPRSYLGAKYHLDTQWKPLHGLALGSIGRANVAAEMRAMAAPVSANRARAALSAFFRWAIGEGLCDANPVAGTNKREENGPRERSLTDAEAAAVWLAASENDYGRIIQLLMLTGCRRDEIGSLQWSEIDLKAKTITLPPARTKNHSEHVVPLTAKALAILKAIPRREGRDIVFGSGKGGYSGWSKSKEDLDEKSKVKNWTLHDIRRTVRTGLGMLGIAPHVAEAVLNHLPAKLIRTYDRNTYAAEKQAALAAWESHLMVSVAKANGANVTALRKA